MLPELSRKGFVALGGRIEDVTVMIGSDDVSTRRRGIGKVIPRQKVTMNVFIEPQVSVADKGDGWPKWQIFVGFNNQF